LQPRWATLTSILSLLSGIILLFSDRRRTTNLTGEADVRPCYRHITDFVTKELSRYVLCTQNAVHSHEK